MAPEVPEELLQDLRGEVDLGPLATSDGDYELLPPRPSPSDLAGGFPGGSP